MFITSTYTRIWPHVRKDFLTAHELKYQHTYCLYHKSLFKAVEKLYCFFETFQINYVERHAANRVGIVEVIHTFKIFNLI